MKEFKERVKSLMERDNISQKELAKLSGISEASVSRYLSGDLRPRMDILANIAKVFNVSTSYLVGEMDNAVQPDAYEETLCVVTRNKSKLDDAQKAEIIKVLFGGK
ncbi:MAG: helix-turn-helix domain-containing protein [Erysipelotrichaceae bacterium]|nr:helix-turn-helix domain-containing protein [Erysipelotrichaceae bacterium]